MTGERLVCTACGAVATLGDMPSTCPVCDGILDLETPRRLEPTASEPEDAGLWRWAARLPAVAPENRVVLGEGSSPLLRCRRLGARYGLPNLWIKNDFLQPTGSFKDRALALTTSLAVEHRRAGVILSSSGNAGASAAAYAARAGLPAVVLVPHTAPRTKLAQILIAGARLVTVVGATSDCCRLARAAARRLGYVNVTTTFYNPYGVDAYATIAYELADLRPDVVLLPISSGPLLAGVMKGFVRLREEGRIERLPRPVAVQSAACAPIVAAFRDGGPVRPWSHRPTVASALNDTLEGYERDGDYTLAWIRRGEGSAVEVDDPEIVRATAELATCEGIVVEPSAAAPVAALGRLLAERAVSPHDRIVLVTTGHGLKDIPEGALPDRPNPIEPSLDALMRHLDG